MNVLITGASRGIGNSLARKFASLDDVTIFLLSRSKKKLEALKDDCQTINRNARMVTIPFDLANLQTEELPEELVDQHFNCIINNAGILINKDFRKIEAEEILHMITVNFIAPALLIRKMLSSLGGSSPSHIVNIGSMGGFQGSAKFPGLSVYSASKAALGSLTECLANELKGNNVFVNCLALGAVQTEMLKEAFPGYKAPVDADEMATYIADFALSGHKYYNGKVLPVSVSTP